MEAETFVKLESLEPYRHLFPPAMKVDKTVKMGASVSDTVDFIPVIVQKTSWQVKDYVNQELRGLNLYDACKKLWHFVKYHIQYEKDERGLEQVRSPRRLIADAKGDCDCMTTFVDTCLHCLGVTEITNRITAYDGKDYFQHIYALVPYKDGQIIMDCVVDKFNYEKPYTNKKDFKMELQFLDGIGEQNDSLIGVDAQDLFGYESDLGELGKLLKRKAQSGGGGGSAPAKKGLFKKKTPEQKQAKKEKRKAVGKKVLKVVNKVNKINPATVLLRAGILASMKLNILKVAEKIKWGYATPEYAESKGMDMAKYPKVKDVLTKTEKIFFAAGGKPENLKKAILTGRGNQNNEVQGVDGLSEELPLSQLLGELYSSEFVEGMEGFEGFNGIEGTEGLGEPATAASIAAASTSMGALALLLKSIGDLFPNKGKKEKKERKGLFKRKSKEPAAPAPESEAPAETPGTPAPEETPAETPPAENAEETTAPAEETENLPAPSSDELEVTPAEEVPEEPEPAEQEETTDGILSGPTIGIKAFYEKHKNWIVPVGVVIGIGTVALIIDHYTSKDHKEEPIQRQPYPAINGTEKEQRKPKYQKPKHNGNRTGQSVIQLM